MQEKIAKWYRQGLWAANMVQSAVRKGIITAKEYQEITGEKYA